MNKQSLIVLKNKIAWKLGHRFDYICGTCGFAINKGDDIDICICGQDHWIELTDFDWPELENYIAMSPIAQEIGVNTTKRRLK